MKDQSAVSPVHLGLLSEAELWPRREDPAARAELAERFLAFAKSIAIRYRGEAESLDDLVQIASLGLMNAIDRFDPDRGMPFVAFATPTIDGELKRHFRDRVSSIRLPRGLYERVGQMESVISELQGDMAHEPTTEEIAEVMGCSCDEVLEAREAPRMRRPVSFTPDENNDEPSIEDQLGQADPGYGQAEDRIVVKEALSHLDRDDREIVILRYREEMTQTQIAKRIGCSQMQVSRRIRKILDKLSLTAAQPPAHLGPAPPHRPA